MIILIYASSATKNMTKADLMEILTRARENNAKMNITGMLLYHEGNFLQVLEGEPHYVQTLFQKIQADPRHKHVSPILKRSTDKREFGDWKMGFINVGYINPDSVPGYSDFLRKPMTPDMFDEDPSYARVFLETFKRFVR